MNINDLNEWNRKFKKLTPKFSNIDHSSVTVYEFKAVYKETREHISSVLNRLQMPILQCYLPKCLSIPSPENDFKNYQARFFVQVTSEDEHQFEKQINEAGLLASKLSEYEVNTIVQLDSKTVRIEKADGTVELKPVLNEYKIFLVDQDYILGTSKEHIINTNDKYKQEPPSIEEIPMNKLAVFHSPSGTGTVTMTFGQYADNINYLGDPIILDVIR